MATYKTLIASNLDWLMAQAKTNANDLGILLGKQRGGGSLQSTIHRIVTGQSLDPKTASIQPIADYFGVTTEQLRTHDFRSNGRPTISVDNPNRPLLEDTFMPRSAAARSLIAAIEDADKSGLGAEAFDVLRETLRLIRRGAAPPRPARLESEDPPP